MHRKHQHIWWCWHYFIGNYHWMYSRSWHFFCWIPWYIFSVTGGHYLCLLSRYFYIRLQFLYVNYLGLTTELSMSYAQITQQSTDIIIPCFFCIFNRIYQISKKRHFWNKNVDDIELNWYLTDGIGSGLVIHLIFSNHALAKN